jgi:hypothetical protein
MMGKRLAPGRPAATDCDDELPPEVTELVAVAEQAARDLRLAEAEHAYRLALVARAATGRRLAKGGSALEACAKRLGLARSTLQAFSALACCWSREELRAMFARARSSCLSISHLLLVSQLPRLERYRRIEQILDGSLGVRELRRLFDSDATKSCRTVQQSTDRRLESLDHDRPDRTIR